MHKRHRYDFRYYDSLPVTTDERYDAKITTKSVIYRNKHQFSQTKCRCFVPKALLIIISLTLIVRGDVPKFFFYLQVTSHQVNPYPSAPQVLGPIDRNVSVVLMNYLRPQTLKALLPTLTSYPYINNILLCHAHPDTYFNYEHEKVRNIRAMDDNLHLGLALRFQYCTQASNDWVIHLDDDQYISHRSLDQLLTAFSQNPRRIVGRYGRGYSYWSSPDNHGYRTTNVLGDVEVVLTKLLVVERELCQAFVQQRHLVDDLVMDASPKWNGEDIFLSLIANHYYGVPLDGPYSNLALPLDDVREATILDDTRSDISGMLDRHSLQSEGLMSFLHYWWKGKIHLYYRGHLWSHAKQRLALLGPA